MDAKTVKALSDWTAPESPPGLSALERADRDMYRFCIDYADLSFGARVARALANAQMKPPPVLRGGDMWVQRYWMYLYGGLDPSGVMAKVHALGSSEHPTIAAHRRVLKGMLLCEEATHEAIAGKCAFMGDPDPAVIEAFDKLYYNVRDRIGENMLLAHEAYPHTRLRSVTDPDPMSESFDDALKRIGHDGDIESVAWFAGMRSRMMVDNMGARAPEMLETAIMANGYVLARNGFINSNVRGIAKAASLIAAAKQGGEDTSSGDTLLGLGETLKAEFVRHKLEEATQQRVIRLGIDQVVDVGS